jgi:DNA-binding transcriptional regulator GbsR (MarR family)
MTSQTRKVSKKYLLGKRRKQVASMTVQGLTDLQMAEKLGVDNTTISKDISVLKLQAKQFVYDTKKEGLAYFYKQVLDAFWEVNRKQWEIVNKEHPDKDTDMLKLKALADIKETLVTISNCLEVAPNMHKNKSDSYSSAL